MLSQAVKDASRVVSLKAIDYEVPANTTFHTAMFIAARDRILREQKGRLANILFHIFNNPAARTVWAIVLQQNNDPLYVIRNIAYTGTSLPYRRILLVKCDGIGYPVARPVPIPAPKPTLAPALALNALVAFDTTHITPLALYCVLIVLLVHIGLPILTLWAVLYS